MEPNTPELRQEFVCQVCGVEGVFYLPDGPNTDALVAMMLFDREHRKLSPQCPMQDKAERLKEMIVRGQWPHTIESGVLN